MAKNLVIVESPAKMKTVKKFLGANYTVEASNGHVRDFPKSQFGIDVDNDFEPKYITIRGKGELLAKLRKEAKKADKIYLATDPDREGEAISWHLMQALKTDTAKMHRITFNEVTKTAVKASIKQARELDMNLVDAQQARERTNLIQPAGIPGFCDQFDISKDRIVSEKLQKGRIVKWRTVLMASENAGKIEAEAVHTVVDGPVT